MEEDITRARGIEDRNIATEAAQWLFRMREEPDVHCNAEFIAWLKRSPRHMGEFLFASAAFELARGADPERALEVDDGLDEAPAEKIAALPLRSVSAEEGTLDPGVSRWPRRAAIAATLVLGIGVAGWWLAPSAPGAEAYLTQVGEQRSFKLEDGSVLYLNTRSQARVEYSPAAREVRLTEGEALFVVAPDRARPFIVRSGAATVEAVGTQFNVYQRNGTTTVSVIEGRVKVSRPERAASTDDGMGKMLSLGAGEEVQVSETGPVSKRPLPNPARTVAWRQRRLMFEATPLIDVAREFNRYNRLQIRIEAPAVESMQITGTFNADEPQALVSFLRGDPSLDVQTLENGVVIHESRSAR